MADWKGRLTGEDKRLDPPANLHEILSTYPLQGRRQKKTASQLLSYIDDFVDMAYGFGGKGTLMQELKALYGKDAVERAYRGERKEATPPRAGKPPLYRGPRKGSAGSSPKRNFTVRSIAGGGLRQRRRHQRSRKLMRQRQ